MAVNLATVCALQTLPINLRQPWLIQLGTLCVSISFSVALLGRPGLVYAFGVSIICSGLATSFYDLAFSWVANKIRAVLGVAPDTNLSNPRPSTPDSKL